MNHIDFFQVKNLTVGYNKKSLISNINFSVNKGEILTLIGPNGSGKSTILKTITGHLEKLSGEVYIGGNELAALSKTERAKRLSVVLTERIHPELMTCAEVVASGRYPHTSHFGILTDEDKEIIKDSLVRVGALDLRDEEFNQLSDGQQQRIMLARAICQRTDIIVLDEPTSFLDIRYKIEIMDILRVIAKERNIAIIMSLHEIDLALKVSDKVMCVKGGKISLYSNPEDVFSDDIISKLYDIESGSYISVFGSLEMSKPKGRPKVFIIAGNGRGIRYFRELQRKGIPFSTGIINENDIDYPVACSLADKVLAEKAYLSFSEKVYQEAVKEVDAIGILLNAGAEIEYHNSKNKELIEYAKRCHMPVVNSVTELMRFIG